MSGEFSIDLGALAAAMKELRDFDSWWEQTLSQLDALIGNLHAERLGRTASAHQDAHRRWTEGAAKMRGALSDLHVAGTTSHANYGNAAQAGLNTWTQS